MKKKQDSMQSEISKNLLTWFDVHGRKKLPWQKNKTLYRVWISEIMLQQTQVTTVIPYYQKFMQNFPSVIALANAHEDDVLKYWSGLGYYARARNLHKAAKIIKDKCDGKFPRDYEAVLALPGIGRSTAGAILSLSLGQHHVILDGNVKRVIARLHTIEGWSGHLQTQNKMWDYATQHTPEHRVADYNQAIMDLGATVCSRGKNAQCECCPLSKNCSAFEKGVVAEFPNSKPKKAIPVRKTKMLMIYDRDNNIYIEKRAPVGIWGGLWSFPQIDDDQDMDAWLSKNIPFKLEAAHHWDEVRHTFSHFHLDITPILIQVQEPRNKVMEETTALWYKLGQNQDRGYAAPIMKLLQKLEIELGV